MIETMMRLKPLLAGLMLLAIGGVALAHAATSAASPVSGLALVQSVNGKQGATYSLDIQALLVITALAFLPGIILLMTAFTRIIIVLSILRQALGLQTTPPNMVLIALSLALTVFVMRGVIQQEQTNALQPYLDGKLTFEQAVQAAQPPLQAFMLGQTRAEPLHLFVDLSGNHYASPQSVPFTVLVPAFATSELETAFQIGFLIYIPFVLIDLAVASVLMSLGMIMVSPTLISLPLKLLMFVSIHGWVLILGTLANSFAVPGH
ncbi:flagellar type III secretion system pore protein FliP [Acidocella facilis]|uniref:flagellar type III secretion system pore protein FliP n=1 Tax=Acidocella facilis TaxID=525 RepID=UPI001EEB03A5|nr:flagellar type III secretion system pore protein FliP [Acidocella facilis]